MGTRIKYRKYLFIFVILLFISVVSGIFAGSIEDEFNQAAYDKKNPVKTDAEKKAQLESSLLLPIKRTLLQNVEYDDYEKIKASDFDYERSVQNQMIYYLKYKTYLLYLVYSIDPEEYLTYPTIVKVIKKDKNMTSSKPKQKPISKTK
ncbi:MAG: hypothetical protein OEZ13_01420 [Spirochaetia bacterium]|nr:hypothetical protein [Spirochaetia bacterium]